MHECVSNAVWPYFHEFGNFQLLCMQMQVVWKGKGTECVGVGAYAITGLWEFDGKEWGVSTGDLSPLGLQAHITLLWSTIHNRTQNCTHSFFNSLPSLTPSPDTPTLPLGSRPSAPLRFLTVHLQHRSNNMAGLGNDIHFVNL